MRVLKTILDLLLYSNIFISLCAAAMAVATYWLEAADINWIYGAFIFSSSVVLYNYPSLFLSNGEPHSERQKWICENKKTIRIVSVPALISSGTLALFFPLKVILWFIPVSVLAFAYFLPVTNLRSIPVLKAVVVAFVWICVTYYFPSCLINDSVRVWTDWGGAARFFFLLSLAIAFNIRDVDTDTRSGIRTLPVILGVRRTKFACLFFLALGGAAFFLTGYGAIVKAALLASCLGAALLIVLASDKRPEYYYSLWMDGIILIQAVLVMLLGR